MKPFHVPRFPLVPLVAFGLAVLAPTVAGCGAEEDEGAGAQFPPPAPMGSESPQQLANSPGAPGEAPTPITMTPIASPPRPPPPPPPPQEIVPGSTTEEDYEARAAANPNLDADENEYADTDPSALTDFRQALDPYGSWVDDPNYGTVWTPSESVVGDGFAPYVTGGQWSYDEYNNWTWVSDYDWGWAPFHYGRWAYLGSRWGWIPGREYAGAWVNWRTGYGGYENYLGWAPMAPRWGWRNGSAFNYGFATRAPFVFCGAHDVFNPGVGSRIVTGAQVGVVGSHTRSFAAPSVGGPGGRVPAHPTVGPSPGSVGISPNEVARTPVNNRGIMHAQTFARPSTAQAMGAHAAASAPYGGYAHIAPQRSSAMASAYGRVAPIGQAPQYRGISPTPYHYPSHTIGGGAYGGYGAYGGGYGGAPHYGSSYSAGRYASPAYGGGVYGAGYGGYHGGGGTVHPSNGGSAPSSYEDSSGSPFHGGSRGGGGFRGGGGGHGGGGHGGGGHR